MLSYMDIFRAYGNHVPLSQMTVRVGKLRTPKARGQFERLLSVTHFKLNGFETGFDAGAR